MSDGSSTTGTASARAKRRLPVLQGIVPLDRKGLPMDVAAGVTLGIPTPTFTKWIEGSSGTIEKFLAALGDIGEVNAATIWVSVGVIVVTVGAKMVNPRIPGALIAVIGAIFVSWNWDLATTGSAGPSSPSCCPPPSRSSS